MKRFLAAILSLTLILSALCAVGVSAEETYPKDGTVYTYVDDFSTYALDTQPSNWGGSGTGESVNLKVKETDGERYLQLTFNGAGLISQYFKRDKMEGTYYIRYACTSNIALNAGRDYSMTSEYAYYKDGAIITDPSNSNNTVYLFGQNGLWLNRDGTQVQQNAASTAGSVEFSNPNTKSKLENGRYLNTSIINVAYFDKDKKKTSGSLTYGVSLAGYVSDVKNIVKTIMAKDDYKDITAYSDSDEACAKAAAEIETELAGYEIRFYNLKVSTPVKLYTDTVTIRGGNPSRVTNIKTAVNSYTGESYSVENGGTVVVNNYFPTEYQFDFNSENAVIGRVLYNGMPVWFKQNGSAVNVSIPVASKTNNGTFEIVIAENSEYVTNTYTATFKGGKAVNDVANPSLTSTDGRVTLQGANALTGNEANIADSAAGTFAYNSNSKVNPGHRMGVVFNKNAENPIYYACGRNYNWKLFHTGTYKPGYLQWSNPISVETCKSLKDNKQLSQRFINGTSNGPSGNGANTGNYVWNDNSNGTDYIRFYATKGGDTTGNEYGYSIPGNIEILPGSKGVFNGFEYSETVMMHKISFEGEGTLKVTADSLNNFDNNKCNATLTNGQSANVEDLMKADFTVTAPENKVIEAIKYVTYDGETEVGTELIGQTSGSFSIQPVEASGTIEVTYKDNTPVEPKIEYSGSNVEHNKEYTVDGATKTSANSIIMYGTVTGEFDAYGFILSQFGADSVKTGEIALAAETKSADGKFAIRVVGDGITVGKYSAAPYSVKTGSTDTDKGTETDITVAATID